MANAVAPPVTPKTTTSVDPLYSEALAQAKAALAAETAPIQGEQAASDAQFQARQTDATNNAAAVSNLLKGIGPAVNGEYQTGAQNVELAANGFSHGMQDALQGNTDNLNAMLAKLGSPAQLDSHASQAGDVLYALHGYNPGTTFSKQGANFGAAADLQAGDALLKGQENVKQLQGQKVVADQGFQAKIAEMAGKLPGDTETNYQHLQTLALNDAKFRELVRRDNIDQAYKAANLKLAYAKYSTGVNEFNAKQTQQQAQFSARQSQQLAIASARLAQQKYISDRSYAISLAKLGIEQTRLQQTIIANSFRAANGGLTKMQVTKYASQAESIALDAYNGRTKVTMVGGVPKQTTGIGAVSYNEALQRELKTGMPVQMALDALDRIYPANLRPDDAHLAQMLGALDPSLVQSVAADVRATQTAADSMSTNPTWALKGGKIPPEGLQQLAQKVLQAVSAPMATQANVQALVGRIMQESGGNPNAVNLWDSNAQAGHPSKGLLQTIDSTFSTYALPGHTDIWNPYDNALAAVRYMLARYGRIVGPSSTGY